MQKRNKGGTKPGRGKAKASEKRRSEGTVGRFARIVDAAMKDAEAARKSAFDPQFKRGLGQDRRSTLSKFRTVQHALADRERIEKAKRPKPPSG
jgi:hypothetical protein